VVRGDAAGEEVGICVDQAYDSSIGLLFCNEGCPDGEKLAELQGVLGLGEIELDLNGRVSSEGWRKEGAKLRSRPSCP